MPWCDRRIGIDQAQQLFPRARMGTTAGMGLFISLNKNSGGGRVAELCHCLDQLYPDDGPYQSSELRAARSATIGAGSPFSRLTRFLPRGRYVLAPLWQQLDRPGAPYGDGWLQTHMQGSWTKTRAYLEAPGAPGGGSLVVVLDEAAFRTLVNGQVARVSANNGEPVNMILENFGFNRMTEAVMSAARREPQK